MAHFALLKVLKFIQKFYEYEEFLEAQRLELELNFTIEIGIVNIIEVFFMIIIVFYNIIVASW